MSKKPFKAGQLVTHDYSGYDGQILEVRDDPNGYNYLVRFTEGNDPVPVLKDWFKADVLVNVEQDNEDA